MPKPVRMVCLYIKEPCLHRRSAAEPPQEAGQSQHKLALDGRLSIVVGYDRCFERAVVLGVLKRRDDRLGREAMPYCIAAGPLFAFFRLWPVLLRALRRLASICLNDVIAKVRR
jgi:hypothetical protein